MISSNLSSFFTAIAWPLVLLCALVLFRRSVPELLTGLSGRVNKVSIGGFAIELAKLDDRTPRSLELELRSLAGAPKPTPSGSIAISRLFGELQYGLPHGYVVIDLGSENSPRWLNSRLYLLTFLMTWLDHVPPVVFLETAGGIRRRFVGVATPERIRWALAMHYPWLESAMAKAYAEMDQAPRPQFARGTVDPQSGLQFDPGSKTLTAMQAQGVIDRFLFEIQRPPSPPPQPGVQPDLAPGWVVLKDGTTEFSRWLQAERVERLLGPDLSRAAVLLEHNQVLEDMGPAVLKQEARFVAVLTTDRVFRALLDRAAALEQVAWQYVRRAGANQGRETAE